MRTIAMTELKRLLMAPTVISLLILAPLTLIFILGFALADVFQPGDAEMRTVKLAYCDEDQGTLSQGFKEYLKSLEAEGRLVGMPMDSEQEVAQAVKRREAHIGVHIPEGFSQAVLSGGEASWEVLTGRDQVLSKAGIMFVQAFLDEANRMQSIGIVLGTPEQTPASEGNGSSYVKQGALHREEKEYSALQYYAASMLVMFLLYSGLMAAVSILKEKEDHTLMRLQSMPISTGWILFGKVAGNSMLAAIQAAVIIAVTAWAFGADWGDSIGAVSLVCLLTILASMGLGLIAAFLFRGTKAVGSVFASFIGMMTFVSGGMMPTDGTFLDHVKQFTVNYWASNSLMRLMSGQGAASIGSNLTVLGLTGCALLLIAMVLYRRVGYHE